MQTIRDTAGEMINRVEGNLRSIEHDRMAALEESIDKVTQEAIEKDEGFVNIEAGTVLPFPEPESKTVTTVKEEKPKAEKPKEERKSIKEKLSEMKKEVEKEKSDKTKAKAKEKEKKGGSR